MTENVDAIGFSDEHARPRTAGWERYRTSSPVTVRPFPVPRTRFRPHRSVQADGVSQPTGVPSFMTASLERVGPSSGRSGWRLRERPRGSVVHALLTEGFTPGAFVPGSR